MTIRGDAAATNAAERPSANAVTNTKSVAAVILGGGAGTRLYPLTKSRAKPAVPIGGAYRLIDVPMSNEGHKRVIDEGNLKGDSLRAANVLLSQPLQHTAGDGGTWEKGKS